MFPYGEVAERYLVRWLFIIPHIITLLRRGSHGEGVTLYWDHLEGYAIDSER